MVWTLPCSPSDSPQWAASLSGRDEPWLFLAPLDGVRFGVLTMALSWV